LTSNPDGAALNELKLNGVIAESNPGASGAKGDESRAPYVEVVVAGGKGADLPSDFTVNFNDDEDVAVRLILAEAEEVVGGDGDVIAVDEWGPHVFFLVTLVGGRD